jgi:Fanconi anemia group M protein
LCSTSIGEEGLSLPAVDMVIFYEPVPSEIRTIQRRGRTARTRPGRVIFLITKGTRDEGYYWSAYHKERKMRRILRRIQDGLKVVEEKKLSDYVGIRD